MTQPSRYRGLPVSEGTAAGQLYPGDTPAGPLPATPEQVAEAFAAVARERFALAQQLREGGRGEEAGIVAIGALIAADPALVDPAVTAAMQRLRSSARPPRRPRRSPHWPTPTWPPAPTTYARSPAPSSPIWPTAMPRPRPAASFSSGARWTRQT